MQDEAPAHAAHLEVGGSAGWEVVELRGSRVTVGREGADLELDDPTVSRLHALLNGMHGGWILEDLGSRNGTFVEGERLLGPRALRDGDEVRFGRCPTVFRLRNRSGAGGSTDPMRPAPPLTTRERDALVALCRPLLQGTLLAEPASLRAIAAELVITESGAKKLLSRVYDRFELIGDDRRRTHLAVEALRRGAVSRAEAAGS